MMIVLFIVLFQNQTSNTFGEGTYSNVYVYVYVYAYICVHMYICILQDCSTSVYYSNAVLVMQTTLYY